MIFRNPESPNQDDRNAFEALTASYEELVPEVADSLSKLWRSASVPASRHDLFPRNGQELFDVLSLECASIEESGSVELLCEGSLGLFTVAIEGANVEPRAFEG